MIPLTQIHQINLPLYADDHKTANPSSSPSAHSNLSQLREETPPHFDLSWKAPISSMRRCTAPKARLSLSSICHTQTESLPEALCVCCSPTSSISYIELFLPRASRYLTPLFGVLENGQLQAARNVQDFLAYLVWQGPEGVWSELRAVVMFLTFWVAVLSVHGLWLNSTFLFRWSNGAISKNRRVLRVLGAMVSVTKRSVSLCSHLCDGQELALFTNLTVVWWRSRRVCNRRFCKAHGRRDEIKKSMTDHGIA